MKENREFLSSSLDLDRESDLFGDNCLCGNIVWLRVIFSRECFNGNITFMDNVMVMYDVIE